MEDDSLMSEKATALLEQILELQQELLDVAKEDARLSAEFRKRAIRSQQFYIRAVLVLFALATIAILFGPVILRSFLVEAQ
jgi:hypothetical protein